MKQIFLILLLYSTGMMSQNTGIFTKNPGSSLAVNGSFAGDYKIVTGNVILNDSDSYIAYNGNTDGIIQLPVAISGPGNFKGRIYRIKNTTGNWNLTVAAQNLEKINAVTEVSSILLPPGFYAEFISKGTTTGTTWELTMRVPVRLSLPKAKVVDIAYSVPRNSSTITAERFTIKNGNPQPIIDAILPHSSTSFSLSEPQSVFLNFTAGIDNIATLQPGQQTMPTIFYRCELYIDNVATGLFQIVPLDGEGSHLRFSLFGVRDLPAGQHTIHAKFSLWFAGGNNTFTTQFGVMSLLLSATYTN
ncbi:MAG: hypothetical protein BGO88_00010 [Flavobacterium sp. 38-13]|uniref:hypothetical protein n=1 Tax=Flavobacterium sp. 38-13 TaxID=1896168 RepID=UPI000959C41E|nr:hypothetical protein [Flavobacterium sp. 38-13]OJX48826.1 MAG: hypothetical protein BGO88_00010 [Flavobacterium sp. 38-13]